MSSKSEILGLNHRTHANKGGKCDLHCVLGSHLTKNLQISQIGFRGPHAYGQTAIPFMEFNRSFLTIRKLTYLI